MGCQRYSTAGEEVAAAYFADHGLTFLFEPQWSEVFGVDVLDNPDFLLDPDGARAVVEVKQFETTRLRDRLGAGRGMMTLSNVEVYGPIRRQITQPAREQLLPFAALGVPLVVVLTNPLRADVNLDEFHVTHAILGNPKYAIGVGPDGPSGEGRSIAEDHGAFVSVQRDGSTINHHPHVSAVVVIHERDVASDWREGFLAARPKLALDAARKERVAHMISAWEALERAGSPPDGTYRWASVYDLSANPTSPGFGGTPLPRTLFAGPRDEWFGFMPEGFGRFDARSTP